jgi:hypothetical protein
LLRNAQKRDKNNRTKQPKEKKKKTEGKKAAFFVMSQMDFFRVFELTLLRNAQKMPCKKID